MSGRFLTLVGLLCVVTPAVVEAQARQRVAVVAQGPGLQPLVAQLEAELLRQGARLVPEQQLREKARQQTEASTAWRQALQEYEQAEAAQRELRLAEALARYLSARVALEQLHAAWLAPELYQRLLLRLATAQEEAGDTASARVTLEEYAGLFEPRLDEREYPPRFVALAAEARRTARRVAPGLPLEQVWASGEVDRLLVLEPTHLPGERPVLLARYESDSRQPVALRVLARSEQVEQVALALDRLGEGVGDPPGLLIDLSAVLGPNFLYRQQDFARNYLGLELGVRVPVGGVSLGGRLLLTSNGPFVFYLLARWTLPRGRLGLFLEPGALFISDYDEIAQRPWVSAGALLGTGLNYQLDKGWSIEGRMALGGLVVGRIASEQNAPLTLHVGLTYGF